MRGTCFRIYLPIGAAQVEQDQDAASQGVRVVRPLSILLAKQTVAQRPLVKVLLTSGFAGESLDEWLSEGAWPFLRKPFLSTELAEALANLEPEPHDRSRADTSSRARG